MRLAVRAPRVLVVASLAASLASCATNPATGRRELSLVSERDEIALGQQEAAKVNASMPALNNQAIQDMVRRIGMEMATSSERPGLPWSFVVLDDPVVNAFALPGGPIYITRGILTHMNSEGELASVLGHEIGHVTARHSASQISKQQIASLGLGIASIVSQTAAEFVGAAAQGLGVLFLKYGRDDEREADELGFRYMVNTKWDPHEAVSMFQMLSRTSGTSKEGRPPEWLSTHPDPGDRAARATARLQQVATPADSLRRGREPFLRAIDGLVFGTNPREGFFRGATFYHPDLALQLTFPDGWQLQNQPSAVVAGEPQGRAIVQMQLAKGSPDEALRSFSGAQGLSGVRAVQVDAGGLPARSAVFAAQTQHGQIEGAVTFAALGGRTYEILSLTGQGSLATLEPIHRRVVGSLQAVRDPAILGIQPPRMKVIELPSAMTVEEFYSRYPSAIPLDQLLIVNGLERGAQLSRGQLVKQIVAGQ